MLRIACLLAGAAALTACVAATDAPTLSVPGAPAVPVGAPLTAAQIPALVDGGPYTTTIYDGGDAGTTAVVTWNFATDTVSGDFLTADGGTGTFMRTISLQGDLLCSTGAAGTPECHAIYPYQGGFMEVTPAGTVHAVSVPT